MNEKLIRTLAKTLYKLLKNINGDESVEFTDNVKQKTLDALTDLQNEMNNWIFERSI